MLLDPRYFRLDALLSRPYTPTTPFGSSGDCVWATSPQGWGFSHGVHWVHKTGADGLGPIKLTLRADGRIIEPGDAVYRPSHVTLHSLDAHTGLQITEDKFITQDDVVVSVLSFRNPAETMTQVDIDCAWGVGAGENEFRKNISTFVHRSGPPGDNLSQSIPAGGRQTLVFAVAFAPTQEEAVRRANRWANDPGALHTHAEAYQNWFDQNIPRFECSDPWLTKLWYHRWYLVRKNHLNPRVGLTQEDSFSEGRWSSEWYSASITYGAGHVLRETRWLRDAKYARNYFRGFARNQREDGLFRSWFVDGIARPDSDEGKYTDWIVAGVGDLHKVHPAESFLREALPALEENVLYWQSHSWDDDGLLVVDNHWWTGMEWQPSFFYQSGYDKDAPHPVKRLDLTSYQYANLRALAQMEQLLGKTGEAEEVVRLADFIRRVTLETLWDEETGFFYDAVPGTNEKILSAKTIAAFYPFYAGLPDAGHARRAFAHLFNPKEFWTPYPPASTAQDSPAFSQTGEMLGKPLTVCYWNGPTWPHATSLVISGLARYMQNGERGKTPPASRKQFLELVTSFGRAQFEENDFERPHTGEFYRGDTGAWQTKERDYFHSTWADLILTGVIGLVPRDDDTLEVHPLLPSKEDGGWTYFCVEDVPYRGRLLTLVWDDPTEPEDAFSDGDKGFTVYVDGRRTYHADTLAPFQMPLPTTSGQYSG